jgi:ribosome maturation factor RimP
MIQMPPATSRQTAAARTMRLSVLLLLLLGEPSLGWTTTLHCNGGRRISSRSALVSTTRLCAAPLPNDYKELGELLIRKAGDECGCGKDQLSIEWKEGRIVVMVQGESFVGDTDEARNDAEENIDEEGDDEIDDEAGNYDEEGNEVDEKADVDDEDEANGIVNEDEADNDIVNEEGNQAPEDLDSAPKGTDVTELAKAINRILDDGGVGFMIAEKHAIEVTTPGASNLLSGSIMFESYKGFDVILRNIDSKTNKEKEIDGRLVERNDEFTILNIMGRMKKYRNDSVVWVKLPKSKKEKGNQ